jgi:hypothetical protein
LGIFLRLFARSADGMFDLAASGILRCWRL